MHQEVDDQPSNRWDDDYTPPEDAPCFQAGGDMEMRTRPQHEARFAGEDLFGYPKRLMYGVLSGGRFRILLDTETLPIPPGKTLFEAVLDLHRRLDRKRFPDNPEKWAR